MQHSVATTAFTHLRRSKESRHRHDHWPPSTRAPISSNLPQLGPQCAQPAANRDFHLDTFFNPVWMSGPCVFSFAKDGTVVRSETFSTEPCPGRWSSTGSSLLSPPPSIPSSSKGSGRVDKPWKNVAITEQDDEEFEVMQAQAEVRGRTEAKIEQVALVHTWPPPPLPAPCTECEVLLGPRPKELLGTGAAAIPRERVGVIRRTGTPAHSVPALSYGSSGESESESEMFEVVPGRRSVGRKDVPLEGRVGFGKVARKTTTAKLREVGGMIEEYGWSCFAPPQSEVGDDVHDDFWSPYLPEVWAEDKLTANLRGLLGMPSM